MNFIDALNSKRIRRLFWLLIIQFYVLPSSTEVLVFLTQYILQLKKSSRRLLKEKPTGSNEEGLGSGAVQAIDAIEYTSRVKVEKIGDLDPVQDFEAMMSRRDGTEWVNKAIQDMKNKIFDMVENSFEGDTYHKALECLVALRKGCILEQVSFLSCFVCLQEIPKMLKA